MLLAARTYKQVALTTHIFCNYLMTSSLVPSTPAFTMLGTSQEVSEKKKLQPSVYLLINDLYLIHDKYNA